MSERARIYGGEKDRNKKRLSESAKIGGAWDTSLGREVGKRKKKKRKKERK